jgi:hypothetical protein
VTEVLARCIGVDVGRRDKIVGYFVGAVSIKFEYKKKCFDPARRRQ